jgi:hypothetical protein
MPPAAELIERLKDISERRITKPETVRISESPILQVLLAEGTGVVDPLLKVLDHDQRPKDA